MKTTQIKTKQRVKDKGEVFTAPREVNAMLDLIPLDQYTNPLSTWLEPACGNGNFLIAILARKVAHCPTDANPKIHALKVLSSLYGVDIAEDNIGEAKLRLLTWLGEHVSHEQAYLDEVSSILMRYIIVADTLATPNLPFVEYIWIGDTYTFA